MQYSININQLVLSETTLDLSDSAILQYITLICASVNPSIEKNRKNGYTWLNYTHLINEMPLLRIKSISPLVPRIKRIEESGFISTQKIGKRLYVKPTEKIDELFVKQNDKTTSSFVKQNDTVRETERSSFCKQNESLYLNNHNTNIPAKPVSGDIEIIGQDQEKIRAKNIAEIIDTFKSINPLIKFSNKTERASCEELIDTFGGKIALELAKYAAIVQGRQFAPTITTPYELVKKVGKLKVFYKRNQEEESNGMIGNMSEVMSHFNKKST